MVDTADTAWVLTAQDGAPEFIRRARGVNG